MLWMVRDDAVEQGALSVRSATGEKPSEHQQNREFRAVEISWSNPGGERMTATVRTLGGGMGMVKKLHVVAGQQTTTSSIVGPALTLESVAAP